MIDVAQIEKVAPCPKCRADMVLAVVMPHPIATQLARHTYLCAGCNQTTTYILPIAEHPDGGDVVRPDSTLAPEDRRSDARHTLNAAGTLYHKEGGFLLPCSVRDLSRAGARIELFKEAALPQYFRLSLMPDGSAKRLCSKVWQIALVVGVRFVEKQTL